MERMASFYLNSYVPQVATKFGRLALMCRFNIIALPPRALALVVATRQYVPTLLACQ